MCFSNLRISTQNLLNRIKFPLVFGVNPVIISWRLVKQHLMQLCRQQKFKDNYYLHQITQLEYVRACIEQRRIHVCSYFKCDNFLFPLRRAFRENLMFYNLVKISPWFYKIWKSITTFTIDNNLSLSWMISSYLVRFLSEWFVTC